MISTLKWHKMCRRLKETTLKWLLCQLKVILVHTARVLPFGIVVGTIIMRASDSGRIIWTLASSWFDQCIWIDCTFHLYLQLMVEWLFIERLLTDWQLVEWQYVEDNLHEFYIDKNIFAVCRRAMWYSPVVLVEMEKDQDSVNHVTSWHHIVCDITSFSLKDIMIHGDRYLQTAFFYE